MSILTRTLLILFCSLCFISAEAQKKEIVFRNADEYYDEAVKQARLRNYNKAISLAQKGLKMRSNFMDMHLLIGKLYTLTKNYDSARYHIKIVITNDPRYRDAYFYAINIESSTGHLEEALCYADDALYFFPNDKEFLLKKLSLLEETNRRHQSVLMAQRLLDKYPSDAKVVSAFIDHKLSLGRYFMQRGSLTEARIHFENALAADPSNREALNALYNIEIRSGNFQAALNRLNYALIRNPNSYDLLMTQLGIQQNSHAYAEALETIKTLLRYYPRDPKTLAMEKEIRLQAARYYLAMDPLMQYLAVLEKDPANRESLNRVIGINHSRGNLKEAMLWINTGLRSYPNDPILMGQKVDILEQERNFTEAARIASVIYRRNPNMVWRNRVIELSIASAQSFAAQQMYDSAVYEVNKALALNESNYEALQKKINYLTAAKDYDAAMDEIDFALQIYPNDVKTLLTKASIAELMGNSEEAAGITASLVERDPKNKKINSIYIEQRLSVARKLMQSEEFDMAREQLRYVIQINPTNKEALNYLINLESATKNYDSALYYVNQALKLNPINKDFLLKKASIFELMQQYEEAYQITYALMHRYPYNIKIKQAYIDQVLASGKQYQKDLYFDSAFAEFKKVLEISPKDTNALMYAINLLNEMGSYDQALELIDQGLKNYPQKEFFHLKKAVVLENMRRYDMAALYADTASKINPTLKNIDYADYLKSMSLKNEFGIYFLRSSFDDPNRKSNIATLEYRRYYSKGSFATRLNYAGRAHGTGYQVDLESYLNHNNNKDYSHAIASFSDGNVFPLLRLSYSYVHAFKGWEGELGGRFVKTKDEDPTYSLTAAASTYFGDFMPTLRGYAILANNSLYQTYTLTNRYFMNDQKDYIQVFFALGTIPDDISRNYNLTSNLEFVTTTIGASYMKSFKYRNKIGLTFNWINQKIETDLFRNQYDVYLTYQRKF